MVELAQNLPEGNFCRSWLIILAPALTLMIKYAWTLISPEVAQLFKSIRADIARKRIIRKIEALLADPDISEAEKTKLRQKKEQAKLSAVESIQQYLDAIAA